MLSLTAVKSFNRKKFRKLQKYSAAFHRRSLANILGYILGEILLLFMPMQPTALLVIYKCYKKEKSCSKADLSTHAFQYNPWGQDHVKKGQFLIPSPCTVPSPFCLCLNWPICSWWWGLKVHNRCISGSFILDQLCSSLADQIPIKHWNISECLFQFSLIQKEQSSSLNDVHQSTIW